jgi:site-specific DNA-methyltransferase (adenine-specific)
MTASKTGKPSHNNWSTPAYLYDELNAEFSFTFDPCPLNHNLYEWDGLEVDWGKSNFVNPPYDRKGKEAFINKAHQEQLKGNLSVMLLPVSTSTKIFHGVILPNAEVRFIKGRVKFGGAKGCGTFDSMLCIFRPKNDYNADDKKNEDDSPNIISTN